MKLLRASTFAVLIIFIALHPEVSQTMIYTPEKAPGMGDQWLFHRDGVHYLYHLYEMPAGRLHGVYLAASTDGVNYREIGPVIEKKEDADWLGSGAVWRSGDRYIMNFSEARAHQSISFAESKDLVHWTRLGDEFRSDPDPRWYEVGRWDCIWAMPRPRGGFRGYLSANPWRRGTEHPEGLEYRSTGMLESEDGARWTAVAPPVFEWGDTPEMVNVEVAAVVEHDGKHYMIIQTWGDYLGNTASGAYVFIGDGPEGPFRPDKRSFRLLGNTTHRATHFPRFYDSPDGLLVNHFGFTRSGKAWLAPLKRAVFDEAGSLRLGWWSGNDVLKGETIPVRSPVEKVEGAPEWLVAAGRDGIVATTLASGLNLTEGVILEGVLRVSAAGEKPAQVGFHFSEGAGSGTAMLLGTDGQTRSGALALGDAPRFEPDDFVQAGISPDADHTFRLLIRQGMVELYLDDRLVQCYCISGETTGEIGLLAEGAIGAVSNVRAWRMAFADVNAASVKASPTPSQISSRFPDRSESHGGSAAGALFFEPPSLGLDNWCIKKDDLWYVFICQGNGIGVSTSSDLTSYEYKGLAIPGGWYRGDTFERQGRYYMLYSQHGGDQGNFVNLAESDDLLTWRDHPGNPVMMLPDSRWYDGATYGESLTGRSSCRDVSIVDDACDDEWVYLCFTGETGRGDLYRRGCIGLARSRNLTDWEYLPPLFSPGIYTAMEVPQVCQIGDRWFLTWLTAPWYGFRTDEDLDQRAQSWGETMIYYAVADHPLGPYRTPDAPTLFRGLMTPYVIDLVRDGDETLLVPTVFKQKGDHYTDRERFGITPALPIRQTVGNPDRLEVRFPERVRDYFKERVPLVPEMHVNTPEPAPPDISRSGPSVNFQRTSLRLVELTESIPDEVLVDLECRVEAGRAGVVLRYDPAGRSGCAVLVDPARGEVQFAELAPIHLRGMIFRLLERQKIPCPMEPSFRLSVVSSNDYQMVFVNDVLAGAFSFARREQGSVALALENASGECWINGIFVRGTSQ